MKKVIAVSAAVACIGGLAWLSSCGSKSSTPAAAASGTTSTTQTMDQLPKVTSPVVSGSAYTAQPAFLGATGVNLSTASTTTFSGLGSSGSRAMCEATNVVKNLINDAAKADKILCYIQNVMTSSANSAVISAAGVNLYDGSEHVFALNFGDGATTLPKVKMKITKAAGKITDFQMHSCMGQNGVGAQSEYVGQTISGSNINMTSISIGSQGNNTWKNKTTAAGTLNSSMQFLSKEIQSYSSNVSTSNSSTWTNYGFSHLDQFPDYVDVYGYFTGANSGGTTYTNVTKVAGEIQLLGSSTAPFALTNLALGDGSVVGTNSGSWGSNYFYHTFSDSWLGDTKLALATASSGSYFTAASALTVPATDPTATASAIAYTGDEVWDCSGTAEVTLVVDQASLEVACSAYGLGSGDSWINCYSAFGN